MQTLKTILRPWLSKGSDAYFSEGYRSRRGIARGYLRKGGFGFLPRKASLEESCLRSLDLRDKLVWDIGGFEGLHAIYFAYANQGQQVYCFEPNPHNRMLIEENIRVNSLANVRIVPFAVAEEDGQAELSFDPEGRATGSLNTDIAKRLAAKGAVEKLTVSLRSLDSLLEEGAVEPPGFIKLDTEGYEVSALRGAQRVLSQHQPLIFLENHGADEQQKFLHLSDIFEILRAHNYSMVHIESGRWLEKPEIFANHGHLLARPR